MKKRKDKILIADDDPAILDSLKMMLEIWNYEVEAVDNGNILAYVKKLKPQLLLLDVRMSGSNGLDVCRELKEDSRTKNIPVILFSANNEYKGHCRLVGANDFIAKPFNVAELLIKIEEQLTAN